MSNEQKPNLIMASPELRKMLQELAVMDFEKFLKTIRADEVQVFICAENLKSRSYQAIANSLKRHGVELTRQAIQVRCRKCQ